MKKRKQITVKVETGCDSDGFPYTLISTYKEELGVIFYLEESDGFRYNVKLPIWNGFEEETFEKEMDAVRFIVKKSGLCERYENIKVKLGYYSNSEWGAITYRDDIDNINLAL